MSNLTRVHKLKFFPIVRDDITEDIFVVSASGPNVYFDNKDHLEFIIENDITNHFAKIDNGYIGYNEKLNRWFGWYRNEHGINFESFGIGSVPSFGIPKVCNQGFNYVMLKAYRDVVERFNIRSDMDVPMELKPASVEITLILSEKTPICLAECKNIFSKLGTEKNILADFDIITQDQIDITGTSAFSSSRSNVVLRYINRVIIGDESKLLVVYRNYKAQLLYTNTEEGSPGVYSEENTPWYANTINDCRELAIDFVKNGPKHETDISNPD